MLILNNEDIDRILTMPACMAVLEELYLDFGQDKALSMPRVDNLLPCGYEGAYYGFKTMGGAGPRYSIMPGTQHVPVTHSAGWWRNEKTAPQNYPDLSDLVSGRETGRENDGQITCFVNNIGLGLQFAALGALILKKAAEAGIGEKLPGEWFTESVHP